jgi:hypothetical protein
MTDQPQATKKPGECIPWDEKLKELSPIRGDEQLVKKVWQDVDALGYMYIWQCLLSF